LCPRVLRARVLGKDNGVKGKLMFRKLFFLYLFYVGTRVMYDLGTGTSQSPMRDPQFLEASLERFYQMGVGSKALVIFIGVPLYTGVELIPRESAIVISVCGPLLWEQVILPILRTMVEYIVIPVVENLVRLCQFLMRKTLWLISLLCEKISSFVITLWKTLCLVMLRVIEVLHNLCLLIWEWFIQPLWEALCVVVARIIECLHNLCLLIWDWFVLPLWNGLCLVVPRIIEGLHNLCLLIWDYLWEVILVGRDLCLAVWQPVRKWLVDSPLEADIISILEKRACEDFNTHCESRVFIEELALEEGLERLLSIGVRLNRTYHCIINPIIL